MLFTWHWEFLFQLATEDGFSHPSLNFLGAADTPIWGYRCHLPWLLKLGWISIEYTLTHMYPLTITFTHVSATPASLCKAV